MLGLTVNLRAGQGSDQTQRVWRRPALLELLHGTLQRAVIALRQTCHRAIPTERDRSPASGHASLLEDEDVVLGKVPANALTVLLGDSVVEGELGPADPQGGACLILQIPLVCSCDDLHVVEDGRTLDYGGRSGCCPDDRGRSGYCRGHPLYAGKQPSGGWGGLEPDLAWPFPVTLRRESGDRDSSTEPPAGRSPDRGTNGRTMSGMKLKLDLHDIYNRGGDIDRALRAVIDEAVAKKAPLVEIIPGKGSGALKKHVLRFLDQKEVRALYHRVEKDSNNFGRVFVHFRWK